MKVLRHIHKAPLRVLRIKKQSNKLRFRRAMVTLKIALAQEKKETKEMLYIYRKYTKRMATKEEIKVANKQFLDVLRGIGLGIFAVLPFAPITIPLIIALARKVGVEVMPSAFTSNDDLKIKKPIVINNELCNKPKDISKPVKPSSG